MDSTSFVNGRLPEQNQFRYLAGYSEAQIRALHACSLSVSLVSVVCGITAIAFWVKMDPTKRLVFRLQFFLVLFVWDFVKAVFFLCLNSIRLDHIESLLRVYDTPQYVFCDGWGFLITSVTFFADATMFFLTLHHALVVFVPSTTRTYDRKIICYDVVIQNLCDIVRFRKAPSSLDSIFFKPEGNKRMLANEGGIFRWRWVITLCSIILGFIFSGLVFLDDGHYQINYICSAPFNPIWKRLLTTFLLKFINVIFIPVTYISIIIYFMMEFRNLRKAKDKIYTKNYDNEFPSTQADSSAAIVHQLMYGSFQRELKDLTSEHNERKMKQAMKELKSFIVYPIGYIFVWTSSIVSQILNYIEPTRTNPYGLRVVIALAVPLSCAIDTITFMAVEKPWRLTTENLSKQGLFCINDADTFVHNDPSQYHRPSNTEVQHSSGSINNKHRKEDSNNTTGNRDLEKCGGQQAEPTDQQHLASIERQLRKLSASLRPGELKTLIKSRTGSSSTQVESQTQEGLTSNEGAEDRDENETDDSIDLLEFLRKGPQNTLRSTTNNT